MKLNKTFLFFNTIALCIIIVCIVFVFTSRDSEVNFIFMLIGLITGAITLFYDCYLALNKDI